MRDLETITITEKGQAQFPASWRKLPDSRTAGLAMSAR